MSRPAVVRRPRGFTASRLRGRARAGAQPPDFQAHKQLRRSPVDNHIFKFSDDRAGGEYHLAPLVSVYGAMRTAPGRPAHLLR